MKKWAAVLFLSLIATGFLFEHAPTDQIAYNEGPDPMSVKITTEIS